MIDVGSYLRVQQRYATANVPLPFLHVSFLHHCTAFSPREPPPDLKGSLSPSPQQSYLLRPLPGNEGL